MRCIQLRLIDKVRILFCFLLSILYFENETLKSFYIKFPSDKRVLGEKQRNKHIKCFNYDDNYSKIHYFRIE